jgi:hypothetical protein
MKLLPYQERVVVEKTELDGKIAKLDAFGRSPGFAKLHANEQIRLGRQLEIMEQYSKILGIRIAAFSNEVTHEAV